MGEKPTVSSDGKAAVKVQKKKTNVTSKIKENGEKAVKTTAKPKEKKKGVVIKAFTANAVNNQIVQMRDLIKEQRWQTVQRLKKLIKQHKRMIDKKDNERLRKKNEKLQEELDVLKTLNKDDIAKFALINTKKFDQLVSDTTAAAERVLYRLATLPTIVKSVQEFRISHPGSDTGCAFVLQRLGLQYQGLKAEKKASEAREKPAADGTSEPNETNQEVESSDEGESDEEERKDEAEALVRAIEGDRGEKHAKSASTHPKGASDANKAAKRKESPTDAPTPAKQAKKEEVEPVKAMLAKTIQQASKKEAAAKKKANKKTATAQAPVKISLPAPIPLNVVKSKMAVVKRLKLRGGEDSDQDEEEEDEKEDALMKLMLDEPEKSGSGDESDGEKEDDYDPFFLNTGPAPSKPTASDDSEEDEGTSEWKTGDRPARGGAARGGFRGAADRGRGGGARRGGASDRPTRGAPRGRGGRGGRDQGRGQAPKVAPPADEKLHPSWVAKQKMKEAMKVAPAGKKIVFDD